MRIGWKRQSWIVLVLVGALGACDCEQSGTKGRRPELQMGIGVDESGRATWLLDFGDVTVGASRQKAVGVRNLGSSELFVQVEDPGTPFAVEGHGEGTLVPVGGESSLLFSFAPRAATETALERIVKLSTNEEGQAPRTIRLKGRGVPPALICTPAILDFGKVVRGQERHLHTSCKNPLEIPIVLAKGVLSGNYKDNYTLTSPSLEAPVEIEALGSVELEVRFTASSLGRNGAELAFTDLNGQPLGSLPLAAETVAGMLLLDPADCLDFGYVDIDASRRRSFTVENIGNEAVTIQSLQLSVEQPFTTSAEVPFSLQPRPSPGMAVEVEFHPKAAGRYTTQLQLVGEPASASAAACLTGIGGGPKLICKPERVDFGLAAVGIPVQRRYRCWNDGVVPEGVAIDPLIVEGLESTHPAFRAKLIGEERGQDGYAIGEGFTIEVEFEPQEEGFVQGEIIIHSNVGDEEGYATGVAGDGRALPDCDFSVIPPALQFGTLSTSQELVRSFTIVNHLETACIVSDVRLSEDTDPYYSMTPIDNVLLEGGSSLSVPVHFHPTRPGEGEEPRALPTGEVLFQISNRERRLQEVPLSARVGQVCVILEPTPMDFGKTGVDCVTNERAAFLVNVCDIPVTVTDVTIDGTYEGESFHLRRIPPLPFTLAPRDREELTMRFGPSRLGKIEGLLEISVSGVGGEPAQYFAPLVGEGAEDLSQTEIFTQPERAKVDVLWVIDNSGSMGVFQDIMKDRLPIFISFAMEQDIDYRIAITTTGLVPATTCRNASLGAENGRFFPIDADDYLPPRPRTLSRNTPNLETAWSHNVRVGICHGREEPYEAALRALSPPLINEAKDSRVGKTGEPSWSDGNAGFLRPNASLAVIFLTDEIDQSWGYGMAPAEYVEALRNVKGPKYRNLFKIHAITVPSISMGIPTCGDFLEYGDRLMVGVEATGGTWFNICTRTTNSEAWDEGLRQISKGVFEQEAAFRLKGDPAGTGGAPADEGDLEVLVNGVPIPASEEGHVNWTYDPIARSIDFDKQSLPAPGSEVRITYQLACLGKD